MEGILDDATGKNAQPPAPPPSKPTHPVAPNSPDAPPLPVANKVVPTDSSGRPTGPAPKGGLDGILDSAEGRDPAPPPPPIPPPSARRPITTKTVPAPTKTDLDKVDVYRRVQRRDQTVRRVDGQVTRDWIEDGLAKGDPAVIGLFSQQELNDAGYGHTVLDDVIDQLLETPAKSQTPPTLLPVPGTRVVDSPPPPPPRPRGWVDEYLASQPAPKPAPPAAKDVARLPVPVSGRVRTGPAQMKAPLTRDQRQRLLYGPELADLERNGGRIVSGLDPEAERRAQGADGRPVPKLPANGYESLVLDQARNQRAASDRQNHACLPGGPCYRGPATPDMLLDELREACTGDALQPITGATSYSCLQDAIYGDPSAPAQRSRYFGLAVDQIAPEPTRRRVEAGTTLAGQARDTARRWFGVETPTQLQILEAAEEIVAANHDRFPGRGAVDISQTLVSDKPLLIPAAPSERHNYEQALLDGQAIANVEALRRRDAFINEPMPSAPADGKQPAYYKRGPDGTGYLPASEEDYENAVDELGRGRADALFIPGRNVDRRIPLSAASPEARAEAKRNYEELRTSEASNKDYVPSEGLERSHLSDDTRIYVPGTAAQLDWYIRHRGVDAARDAFAADGWIPHDVHANATERTLYDSRNLEKDFVENVVPTLWETPKAVGVELFNRAVADPVVRVRKLAAGTGDVADAVGAIPVVGSLLVPVTEPGPGESWLDNYSERYPVSGGTMQFGVDLFDRYVVPTWGGLAEGVGNLGGFHALENYGERVLRENRTYVDPLTGQAMVGDIKLVRDYHDHPASTLVDDLSVPLAVTGAKIVPVAELVGKGLGAIERSGRLGEMTVGAGRRIVTSPVAQRGTRIWLTLANPADPVIITANLALGAKRLAGRHPQIIVPATDTPRQPRPRPLSHRLVGATLSSALLLTSTVGDTVTHHEHTVEAALPASEQRRQAGRRDAGRVRDDLDQLIQELETGPVIESHSWMLTAAEREHLLRQLRAIKAVRDEGLTPQEAARALGRGVVARTIENWTIAFAKGGVKELPLAPTRQLRGIAHRVREQRLVIHRALSALEQGLDVPEFEADLPAGVVLYRYTQLKLLEAMFVKGWSLEEASKAFGWHTEHKTRYRVAKKLRAEFQSGGLKALEPPMALWRWFNQSDVKVVQARLDEELAKAEPDPWVSRKWEALLLIAEERLSTSEAAERVGATRERVRNWTIDFLSNDASASAAWRKRTEDKESAKATTQDKPQRKRGRRPGKTGRTVVENAIAALPEGTRVEMASVIETALATLERGEDVPEFGVSLPPGAREHHRTELRVLHDLIVKRRSLEQAAADNHADYPTAMRWASMFIEKGLSGLPSAKGHWTRFTLSDVRDIEHNLLVERGRETPDPNAIRKWVTLWYLASSRLNVPEVVKEVRALGLQAHPKGVARLASDYHNTVARTSDPDVHANGDLRLTKVDIVITALPHDTIAEMTSAIEAELGKPERGEAVSEYLRTSLRVLRAVIVKGHSLERAAADNHVRLAIAEHWVKAFLKHGLSGLPTKRGAAKPQFSTSATSKEILRVLDAIRRGKDVEEFKADLPPGVLAHIWGQLHILKALLIDNQDLSTVADRFGYTPITVRTLKEQFEQGGLAALQRPRGLSLWFSLADRAHIERKLEEELAKDPPDVTELRKWRALHMIDSEGAGVSQVAKALGLSKAGADKIVVRYLETESLTAPAWRATRGGPGISSKREAQLHLTLAAVEANRAIAELDRALTPEEEPRALQHLRLIHATFVEGMNPAEAAALVTDETHPVTAAEVKKWMREYKRVGLRAFDWWRDAKSTASVPTAPSRGSATTTQQRPVRKAGTGGRLTRAQMEQAVVHRVNRQTQLPVAAAMKILERAGATPAEASAMLNRLLGARVLQIRAIRGTNHLVSGTQPWRPH